ncbi:MAG: hypothetical protein ACPGLY_17970 [Rubripirellula sp.]
MPRIDPTLISSSQTRSAGANLGQHKPTVISTRNRAQETRNQETRNQETRNQGNTAQPGSQPPNMPLRCRPRRIDLIGYNAASMRETKVNASQGGVDGNAKVRILAIETDGISFLGDSQG